ncbi:cysteine protease [Bacteroidia bacterium]|nr:cysteine protease [Bacteroidia bacterium]GHT28486.1 cysteine protease [Bacteroidia bacterium]
MKHFLSIALFLLICSCSPQQHQPVSLAQIDTEETAGNFKQAAYLIDLYIAENDLSEDSVYILNQRKDIMHRIVLDFDKDKDSVIEYIKKYYPDVNDEMLAGWEEKKKLEYKIIEGEKKYFDRAASNLFRLDEAAKARKSEVNGPSTDALAETLKVHLPDVTSTLSKTGKTQAAPVNMTVKYAVTLEANAVPDGETVRCWLPFPREDNRRQSNIKLLAVNDNNYIIAPPQYAHHTVYMEKIAKKDEPLTFSLEFSYTSVAEWFNLKSKDIQPYDVNSDLYKTYTAERSPHIVFTDSIKAISERIVGNETNPFRKMQKIWEWVDATYPWAGAREYSTIKNIPLYVAESGHGDCGQVTLTFLALARYNGIPARWQSGFMMHPNSKNLHDWSEFYIEGIGWVPMDESFGVNFFTDNEDVRNFYSNGIDAYRWVVNNDYSRALFPEKIFLRSDDVDFQRGELEWKGGNLYYDKWDYHFDISYK